MSNRNRILVLGVACLALGACSKKTEQTKKPMTTAQRDSAIAASKLPGAGVVGKAIEVADSAESRANAEIPQN